MFHIGVLTPTLESAAALLRHIRSRGVTQPGARVQRPELTMNWAPLDTGSVPWQREDPETVRTQLVLSTVRLRQAGADFFVCTDDTAYAVLDGMDSAELALPGLHVATVVATEAQLRGFARVGLLGTRWTLGGRRYADDLEPLGITATSLPLRDQTTLHSIVFDELVHDRLSLRSRDIVLELIEAMRREGCQAIVLGCPGLSALVSPSSSSLPLLDPTALLADAALAVANGSSPLPLWRGGPEICTSTEQYSAH